MRRGQVFARQIEIPAGLPPIAVRSAFGGLGIHLGFFVPDFMASMPLRVFGIVSNDTLLAIPFFTLMGAILERCGLAEDLLDGLGQLFGPGHGADQLAADHGPALCH